MSETIEPSDVVEEPAAVVEHHTEEKPAWVDDILGAIAAIPEKLAPAAPVTEQDVPAELPGHGDVVEDESPVSKPWTHRGFGSKG